MIYCVCLFIQGRFLLANWLNGDLYGYSRIKKPQDLTGFDNLVPFGRRFNSTGQYRSVYTWHNCFFKLVIGLSFKMDFCLRSPSVGLATTLIFHVLVFPCQDRCRCNQKNTLKQSLRIQKPEFKSFFFDIHEPLMTRSADHYCFFSLKTSQLQLVVCVVVVLCSCQHFFSA